MRKYILITIVLTSMMMSCATHKQVAYFQDAAGKDTLFSSSSARQSIKVQAGDKLMIVVNSASPELAASFNLPVVGYRLGTTITNQNYNSTQSTMCYTVGTDGTIDFPVLGKIKVEGMQRDEVAAYIKNRLVSENLCTDAVVNAEIYEAYVNVMGEVTHPGRYQLERDVVTILDVLSKASDLSVVGLRHNVMVIRQTTEGTQTYQLDLTNLAQLTSSPGYYMQQGDVVYVEPNKMRKRQTTVNGNNVINASFWISMASLAATIATTVSVIMTRK